MKLHEFLDCHYGADGAKALRRRLAAGEDPEERVDGETALHVAVRRRRVQAIEILLAGGADIDARSDHGKTAFAHALRRGFGDVVKVLREHGADEALNEADRLAVAIVHGRLDEARELLTEHPGAVRTGNPEEDRLLADVAGRNPSEPVALLIAAGADLAAPALDGGTPLHQAAWFGQPANARLLLEAGAPLDVFDPTHDASPIHWVAHGSRYSGGAEARLDAYVELARMLLEAGSSLNYPGDPSDAYRERLLRDAAPPVEAVLRAFLSA